MELDAQALLVGVARQGLPQGPVAGIFGPETGIDFDAAVVVAVPFLFDPAQLLALLVGVEVKFLVLIDEPVGRQGQIALDASFDHGFGGGVGIVVQV